MELLMLYLLTGMFYSRKEIKLYLEEDKNSVSSNESKAKTMREMRSRIWFKIIMWPLT